MTDAGQPEATTERASFAAAANSAHGPSRIAFSIHSSSQLTARRISSWFEASLDAVTLIFFPLLVLAPRGVAALISAAGLCGAGLVLSTKRNTLSPALGLTGALLGCLLLWGSVSALWSIDPSRSLIVAARLTGLFAAGLALVAAASSIAAPIRLTLILVVGLALGIVMALTELATEGALSSYFSERAYQAARLNQASIAFAVLMLPVGAMLVSIGYKICAALLAIATTGTICALAGTAAKAALMAGLPMGLLLHRAGPVAARATAVISIIIIVTAPLSVARLARLPVLSESADSVKLSAGHRLLIWSFADDRIAEQPLGGWGLDSSRSIPGGEDPIRPSETWLPLHPHNAPLQLWLELGVPGAVLFALIVALLWRTLAHASWSPLFFAAAGGSLTIAFVGCFATYGIWQEWWLGTLWFSLFLVLVMARVAGLPACNADAPIRISRGSGL